MKCKFIFCFLFVVLLVGCESQPKRDSDGLINIIPTKEKDRGPRKPVDVSHVPNAVPKKEPRTIAGNKSPYKVKGIVYRVMKDPLGYEEKGLASWYGRKFHGRNTSNGERYDMYGMTGAHKTLPIPSYVKVKNLENNREIIVRINDRGPFAPGRIVDLSYAGAQKLGFVDAGTAPVKVTYIDTDSLAAPSSSDLKTKAQPALPVSVSSSNESTRTHVSNDSEGARKLYLQVGAYRALESAKTAQNAVEQHTTWPVSIDSFDDANAGAIHRVQIGPLPDQETLEILQSALVAKGLREPVRVLK